MSERAILNANTKIPAERTIVEIQKMLAKHGATAVLTEYTPENTVASVSFRLDHQGQPVFFRLPANVDPIYVILQNEGDRPWKRTIEHATNVAWRIVRQWIEAQLAIVQAEQVEMVEAFLPFAQNPKTGHTLYETLRVDGFKLLGHDS